MTAPKKQENQPVIPEYIAKLDDANKLRKVMVNAKIQEREDVYWFAFNRLCNLEGMNYNDPMHKDFYSMLTAYEELLTEKNNRTTKANRTRQKLARHSVEKCLEDWAISKTSTMGFSLLTEKNMYKLTAEYIVIKYQNRFSDTAVNAAKNRLNNAGFNCDDILPTTP